jgi:hypothetical protein
MFQQSIADDQATTARDIVASFTSVGYSNREIALLVSAHAGRFVHARTIAGIRSGEYSGRNLWPAFHSLAQAWHIV